MARFPSEEWVGLFVEQINRSDAYREAGATWEGDIAFVFEAEPDRGVPEDLVAWLDRYFFCSFWHCCYF